MRKLQKATLDRNRQHFAEFWLDELGCYCLSLEEDVPSLNISTDSVIYAEGIAPRKGDLIVYGVPGFRGRVMVGRFIRMDDLLVTFEVPGGLVIRYFCQALLVITCIA